MWKLSIEDDQGATTVVQLARADYTIGRGEENTIRLTERNISRRHARLLKQGNAWALLDLGSYNGCFVNGVRTGETHSVGAKDLIQLGDYRLEFITDESLAVTSANPRAQLSTDAITAGPDSPTGDRLVMAVGPTPGREFMLSEKTLTIGRGDDCEISVNHPSVSRHHAEIHHLGDQHYEVIDKKSSNGLRINGVDLERGLMGPLDVIEFGDVVLKLIPTGQTYRPTPEETEKIMRMIGSPAEADDLTRAERLGAAWRGMSRFVRLGVMALAVLVMVMFAAVVVTSRLRRPHKHPTPGVVADPNASLLKQAEDLCATNHFERAHELVHEISLSSPQRTSESVRRIESMWADEVFERADRATTIEEKRSLYESLIRDDRLDATRQDRAKERLSAALQPLTDAGATDAAAATVNSDKSSGSSGDAEPSGPKKLVTAGDKAGKSGTAPNLTRKVLPKPATTSNAEAARLAQAIEQKNQLKAKVASGNSTDVDRRILHALCRQLNDPSCSR